MFSNLVRPQTLTASVADCIRKAILHGDFLPGTPLREIALSKAMGVSRGTVREALRELQDEGLVETLPHKGAFVSRLTIKKVQEIFTLRALLESYAVRIALENKAYTQEDYDGLERLTRRMGELGTVPHDIFESINTDLGFHDLLCRKCGHELLLNMLGNLRAQIRLFIFSTKLYNSDLVADEVSHRAVLDSVRSGDPARAEEAVRKHIVEAGTSLLNRMKEVNISGVNLT